MENTDTNNKDKDCLDPENNSKYCFFKVANAFLLLANMLLIIMGLYFLPNKKSETTTWDILIATLAILVTVLIGWQIYSVFSMRKEIVDFKIQYKKSVEDINRKHLLSKAHLHKSIMDANGRIALLDSETQQFIPYNWHEYLNSTLIALYYLYKAQQEEVAESTMSNFNDVWGAHHYQGIKVDRKTLNEILNNLNRLKGLVEDELYSKFDNIIKDDIVVS